MRHFGILCLFAMSFAFCVEEARWYKGNTHTHTILCGHADSSPEAVTEWYHERGYNFLCLSEHNIFIDPATVKMPSSLRKDFILIPSEEVTGDVHTTALNISRLVKWEYPKKKKTELIQNHVDGVLEAGGAPVLNHPNFLWAVKPEDILPVNRLHLFELYNGHPTVFNEGDDKHISTELLWDYLLSAGKVIYGLASDDMHSIKTWGVKVSNPGRGWIMVRSTSLSPDAITAAIKRGDFYASSGVILKTLNASKQQYTVEVDESATEKELTSPVLIRKRVEKAEPGWKIEFIGKDGRVLQSVNNTTATFNVPQAERYVRTKITFTQKGERDFLQCAAWTQPVFTDDRLERLEKE